MITLNDSINHPLQFITERNIYGQFYNSIDKKYHIAEYVPYVKRPSKYLCNEVGNFSSAREHYENRNKCEHCFSKIEDIAIEDINFKPNTIKDMNKVKNRVWGNIGIRVINKIKNNGFKTK